MGKFIDFDKSQKKFYDNIWLNDQKVVVKIPLTEKEDVNKEILVEKFDLSKYTYLIAYD